jgi:hypothetical protein
MASKLPVLLFGIYTGLILLVLLFDSPAASPQDGTFTPQWTPHGLDSESPADAEEYSSQLLFFELPTGWPANKPEPKTILPPLNTPELLKPSPIHLEPRGRHQPLIIVPPLFVPPLQPGPQEAPLLA